MSTRIAINGFGRIGRLVFRALHEQGLFGKEIEVVAVGDIVPADNLAYLLKYDSIQGKFDGQRQLEEVGARQGRRRRAGRQRQGDRGRQRQDARPSCRGRSSASNRDRVDGPVHRGREGQGPPRRRREEGDHLRARPRARTSPSCMGVNHEKYDPAKHNIVSNASCTTNCLAPVVHVLLKEGFGIDRRPDDDGPHLHGDAEDGRRPVARRTGRAAAAPRINIIPSTTGAAKAVALVLPGGEGQADRHGVPRADADGLGRRPDVQDRQGDLASRRSTRR